MTVFAVNMDLYLRLAADEPTGFIPAFFPVLMYFYFRQSAHRFRALSVLTEAVGRVGMFPYLRQRTGQSSQSIVTVLIVRVNHKIRLTADDIPLCVTAFFAVAVRRTSAVEGFSLKAVVRMGMLFHSADKFAGFIPAPFRMDMGGNSAVRFTEAVLLMRMLRQNADQVFFIVQTAFAMDMGRQTAVTFSVAVLAVSVLFLLAYGYFFIAFVRMNMCLRLFLRGGRFGIGGRAFGSFAVLFPGGFAFGGIVIFFPGSRLF